MQERWCRTDGANRASEDGQSGQTNLLPDGATVHVVGTDAGLQVQVLGRLLGGVRAGVSHAGAAERPTACYAVCTRSEREGCAVLTLHTVRSTGTTEGRTEVEIDTDPWLAELLRSSNLEEAYGVQFDLMHNYPPTPGSAARSPRTVRPLSPRRPATAGVSSTAPRLRDQPSHGTKSVPFQAIGLLSCRATRPTE